MLHSYICDDDVGNDTRNAEIELLRRLVLLRRDPTLSITGPFTRRGTPLPSSVATLLNGSNGSSSNSNNNNNNNASTTTIAAHAVAVDVANASTTGALNGSATISARSVSSSSSTMPAPTRATIITTSSGRTVNSVHRKLHEPQPPDAQVYDVRKSLH